MGKKVIRLNESQFNSIISKMVKMSVCEMAYQRKTEDVWYIQGNYGYGWEDLSGYIVDPKNPSAARKEALEDLKRYRENEPAPYRLVRKRERKEEEELNESLCSDYGFTPNDEIPEECIDYIISNIEDFKKRYRRALNVIDRQRCSLQNADYDLFEEIVDLANEWCQDNGCGEITPETIEEVFG